MGFRTNLLKFDKNNRPEDFTFQLATKNLTHLGKLNNVDRESVHYVGNLNGADEISLKVYKTIDGEVEKLWDSIVDLKLLYVAEVGEYFEIKVSLDDQLDGYKTLTCTSLCEAELSELNIYETEINTEADIDRPDYEITTFYNEENPKASLLHRVLNDKASHYTIKYVDDSLKKLQRSFSINGTSIYDFLTSECAEQFNCLFVFNSPDRSISVYDLYTVCNGCGYRGAYSDVCPECGSDFLNYFGNDTTIYVDKENFAENIKFETTEAIKNCFRLVAGDDEMTATIRSLNQNGSNYIFYFTDEMKKDMSPELIEKLESYDELYDSYTEEYQQLLEEYYKAIDDELYYTSSMMPEAPSDDEDTDNEISIANQEITKLTVDNLSPIGLTTVTTSTSIATINSAIKNYAKVFVNSGLVKVDTLDSSFAYKGKDTNGDNYGEWKGEIQLTSFSDEEDIATTNTLTITVHDNYADFVEQKVLKDIANDDEDHSIYDVIAIDDLAEFKNALTYYSLNRLISFKGAIDTAIDTLIEVNQGSEDSELYNVFYTKYFDKLKACENEINVRQTTIEGIKTTKESLLNSISTIQETLNFEAYLGDLYKEFCVYRREDEYNNSNYISDGLDDSQRIANARDFIDAAKKELYKSATKQNTITADLYNLLAMPEFKPLVESFALGNFIRVNVDGVVYRLRLINFEINFSDLSKLPVQFSDMTQTANGLNDVRSILDSAKSVGKNFAYVSQQAEKGQIANSTFEEMYQNGLNSALYNIINSPEQTMGIGKYGLWGKAWDDIENDYSQEQVRLTNNILCFTDNNWRSVEEAIGKHNYYKFDEDGVLRQYTGYGVSAKFLSAPYINNAQFIGGDIYSTNYSPNGTGAHIDLINGDFSLADEKIVYNSKTNVLNLKGVTLDWNTTTSPSIENVDGLNEKLDDISNSITSLDEEFANELTNYVTNTMFNGSVAELQSQIDGNITTWFKDGTPTLDTYPAKEWTTDEDKNIHLGDLYYDNITGYAYRFQLSVSTYEWVKITDTDVTKALADAKNAQDTADGKRRVFVTTPIPPYDIGDLWVQGDGGDILRCAIAKTSEESYSASDWVLASKYTDDSALVKFMNGEFKDTIADIQNQSDQKAETWYQETDPSTSWSIEEKAIHVGDLWYSINDEKTYIWNGSSWDETKSTPPSEVFDEIDGKAQIFISQPTPPYRTGDLWFNSESSDIMTCIIDRFEGTFVSSDWEKRNKYTDDSALTTFINGEYADDLEKIGTQIDGKARSWYQPTDPSLTWDTTEDHEGDLWYDTDANSQVTSIYVNGTWKATSVPKSLFDTIDGIASIYVTIPDNPVNGDLLIPTNDIGNYKAGKVYKYNGTTWIEISYTDDTKANEALDVANKAQTTADNAKSVAENAETIGNNLVNVLGYDGTKITGTYIYSPVISGGTILVGDKSNTYAEITTSGVLNCAGANISGHINATSLTLGTGVSISSSNVSGLSSVATSGKYSDLTGTPTIPTNITDLVGADNILYSDDITITSSTDETTGITTTITAYGDKTYTTYTSSDGKYVLTDLGIGTDTEDGSQTYTCISTDGLLTAKNALIYGTVYATNGSFTGSVTTDNITATGGKIGNLTINNSGWLINESDNYTVTLRGVQSNTAYGVFYITDKSDNSNPFRVNGDGSFNATKANITGGTIGGINIESRGLYYSGSSSTDGFGLWKSGAHSHNGSYIIMHAGGNSSNIGGAAFRVYQNGSVTASKITITGTNGSSTIGGWKIVGNKITKNTVGISYDTGNYAFWAGGSESGTDPDAGVYSDSHNPVFAIRQNGEILATAGQIGNWKIDSSTGALIGTGTSMRMALYPHGTSYSGYTFYLVIYKSGGAQPIGGLTSSGWINL